MRLALFTDGLTASDRFARDVERDWQSLLQAARNSQSTPASAFVDGFNEKDPYQTTKSNPPVPAFPSARKDL